LFPPAADDLSNSVSTWHSREYLHPSQLQAGDVLVVGAGNSGTQIVIEIADNEVNRQVWLVGPDRGQLPRHILGRDFFRWVVATLFKFKRTGFLGQKLYERLGPRGDPVFSDVYEKMQHVDVDRVTGRITGVENGRLITNDGGRFDVSNVIWATGFRPAYSWIDLDIFTEQGYPRQTQGVVPESPGLYFVVLPWLNRANSSLIGGVGTDAEYIRITYSTELMTDGRSKSHALFTWRINHL
jgi:putative flavoprotein involved in K+ transport